ncbi:STAS domain-containing protein [Lacinutrix sp. C3R15]|uniref:STAS domain-containing protein n=1 Tax=Flavobacteriaceae TaxID=49546 RepID=UPI001C0830EB|nr:MULTISPECIES: STAS domain-containing protein [Flavobacteriaceae]MBU2939094.1 STAS domain-containing protein [Lacinutrix sp. C3R15]MDO6622409.1 STAS domain-containing protein [Oceanihabitans sp. 1_MG-2023]
MKLIVTKNNNTYKVKGSLVKTNVSLFKKQLKDAFSKADDVVLNLQELGNIDNQGVVAIVQLHNEALTKNKKLSIIGLGNGQLSNHFNSNQVA